MEQSAQGALDDWLSPVAIPAAEEGDFLRLYPTGARPRPGAILTSAMARHHPWHWHDLHQISCAFRGALLVESAQGRHLVPPRLAAWIPAGTRHRLRLARVPSVTVFLPTSAVAQAPAGVRLFPLTPLLAELLREAARWPLGRPLDRLGRNLFATLAGLCAEQLGVERPLLLPPVRDPRLLRALELAAAQPHATAAELCSRAGLSTRTFHRRLAAEAGISWREYRLRLRLLKAVSLLEESPWPVGRIAEACGFASPSAFAQAFRARLGFSPGRYRRLTATAAGSATSAKVWRSRAR
ncbi:MAG: AraC family transcriptional regulator [Porticoccaceae bacterium]|nr:MAG: AraC family transcriptional regulator [Porticoccaceae bacterium]